MKLSMAGIFQCKELVRENHMQLRLRILLTKSRITCEMCLWLCLGLIILIMIIEVERPI